MNETLITRVKELSKARGEKPTPACVNAGVGKDFIGNARKSSPGKEKIEALAKYFDVSIDYLVGLTDQKEPAAQVDGGVDPELLELLSRVPAERWDEVKRYLRFQAGAAETP